MNKIILSALFILIPAVGGLGCSYDTPDGEDYQILTKIEGNTDEGDKNKQDVTKTEDGQSLKQNKPVNGNEEPGDFVWDPTVLWSGPQVNWVSFSKDGSKIVFAHQTSGMAHDLYVSDVKTGETRFVSHNVVTTTPYEGVHMNNDGTRLMYRRTVDGGAGSWHDLGEIWTWDWNTSVAYQIAPSALRSSFRFSPTGNHAVYVDTQAHDLILHDFDTKKNTEVDVNIWASPNVNSLQTLPMSDNGLYLAYSKGSTSKSDLYLYNIESNTKELISNIAKVRSIRFEDNSSSLVWMESTNVYVQKKNGSKIKAERLASHNLISHKTVNSGTASYVIWSQDGNKAAFVREPRISELIIWDRITGDEITVDIEVQPASYTFSPSGQKLSYKQQVENASAYIGSLVLFDINTGDNTVLEQDVSLYSNGMWFSKDGKKLVFEPNACKNKDDMNAKVIDLTTLEKQPLPGGFTCSVYMNPDNSGFTFTLNSLGPGLAEHSFESQSTVQLSNAHTTVQSSPNGWASVYSYPRSLWQGWNIHLINWKTHKEVLVEEEGKLWISAVSDTHVAFRTGGSNSRLSLVQLP
ncbi:MAG TPA: hypothetical protein EYN06_01685 [Myxococcales bacterium]|nr:hypothetical protein [Myxococcales bacterium]HIN85162.1 hypothetical protein [Myxococcales bacterium]